MSSRLNLEGLDDLVRELACRPSRFNTLAEDLAVIARRRSKDAQSQPLRRKPRAEPWCYVRDRRPAHS